MSNSSEPNMPGVSHTPIVYDDTPIKWEYKKIEKSPDEEQSLDEEELNKLGSEGWELVEVVQVNSWFHYYFKRPAE